jgi:hypothetical protein
MKEDKFERERSKMMAMTEKGEKLDDTWKKKERKLTR